MTSEDIHVVLDAVATEITDLRILFLAEIERMDNLFKTLSNLKELGDIDDK